MSCPICRSAVRGDVDAMLASDEWNSPNRIARTFAGLSRAQIKRHRDWCLGKIPRIMYCLRYQGATEEDVARHLAEEGKPQEAIDFTLATVRRLIEKAG